MSLNDGLRHMQSKADKIKLWQNIDKKTKHFIQIGNFTRSLICLQWQIACEKLWTPMNHEWHHKDNVETHV